MDEEKVPDVKPVNLKEDREKCSPQVQRALTLFLEVLANKARESKNPFDDIVVRVLQKIFT